MGGSGLLGRALGGSLGSVGFDVVVLSRQAPEKVDLPAGCRAARWDGRSPEGWLGEADGAAAIVNLAGESIAGRRWSAERKRRIVASRVDSTRAAVAALAALPEGRRPPVLLQASGAGIYGDRGDETLDESSTPGEGFLAETAKAWEAASAGADELGVRRVLLRTGVVLAREGGALPEMSRPFRFFVGGRLGDGRQWLPWIHLDDEIAAIAFLLRDPAARGPYNLCAPTPATNAELTRALARALRRPALFAVPAFALRLLLGEMATLVLRGQRVVPRRLLAAGFRFRFANLDAALADLIGRRPAT
jgi:uncharacterized protein (TIGR01777 family)